MTLPFTIEQFYSVFSDYNTSIWPAQVLLVALALAAVALASIPHHGSGAGISAILAFLWAWQGLVYHLAFFSAINPGAYVFAGVSLQGATLRPDAEDNQALYGRSIQNQEIITKEVAPPKAAEKLIGLFNKYSSRKG